MYVYQYISTIIVSKKRYCTPKTISTLKKTLSIPNQKPLHTARTFIKHLFEKKQHPQ